jgi:hypothetical protein
MFRSYAPKCVESEAIAVEDSPQIADRRAEKVASAISIAIFRAASALR